MSCIVTDLVKQQARKLFAPDEAELVISRLEASHFPVGDDGVLAERIHFAVLYLSGGDMQTFDKTVHVGEYDWRDVLCDAGLGGEDWPDVLRRRGIDFPRGTYADIIMASIRRGVA
jgi:hypothetical protein